MITRSKAKKIKEMKLKMRSMFRKGPAKLHAFGSGDFEAFKVSDLSLKNQEKIKAMFEGKRISYDKLRDYVFARLKADPEMKIGDMVYIPTHYLSRPYYGMGVVYFDEENGEKSIGFDEGYPYIPLKYKSQIQQLKKNGVTYDDISRYQRIMPAFPYWDELVEMWRGRLYASLEQ